MKEVVSFLLWLLLPGGSVAALWYIRERMRRREFQRNEALVLGAVFAASPHETMSFVNEEAENRRWLMEQQRLRQK